jgi:hypothetical protein
MRKIFFKQTLKKQFMEPLKMYLTTWQKRMIKDFMPASSFEKIRVKPLDIRWIAINAGPIKCPASYKIPMTGLRKGEWVMYFTDEQMHMVKDHFKLRTVISSINIVDKQIAEGMVQFG